MADRLPIPPAPPSFASRRPGIAGVILAVALIAVACSGSSSSGGGPNHDDAGAVGGTTGSGGSGPTGGTGAGTPGSGGSATDGGCSLSVCYGACVDTQTDSMNCGSCDTVCPQGTSCQGGVCRPQGGGFGAPCTKNSDCSSVLCLQSTELLEKMRERRRLPTRAGVDLCVAERLLLGMPVHAKRQRDL